MTYQIKYIEYRPVPCIPVYHLSSTAQRSPVQNPIQIPRQLFFPTVNKIQFALVGESLEKNHEECVYGGREAQFSGFRCQTAVRWKGGA